jgi:predicted transcriptional regulator
MSRALTVELSDEVFDDLSRQAATAGVAPEELAAAALEQKFADRRRRLDPAARGRFERLIGSVDLGRPVGLDNEQIDADLAREYGRGLD